MEGEAEYSVGMLTELLPVHTAIKKLVHTFDILVGSQSPRNNCRLGPSQYTTTILWSKKRQKGGGGYRSIWFEALNTRGFTPMGSLLHFLQDAGAEIIEVVSGTSMLHAETNLFQV